MSSSHDVIIALRQKENPERSELLEKYFKAVPGQYGEGDIFFGLYVPEVRAIAKRYLHLTTAQSEELLHSPIHEARLAALIILVMQYKEARAAGIDEVCNDIFDTYIHNTKWINNWDLVDTSAPHIVGAHLEEEDRGILRQLAVSKNLWERRIAIIATHYFISREDYTDTLQIAEMLLHDNHDLIHKAVGWSLREVGKKEIEVLTGFLDKYAHEMPRTMLRYAIERLESDQRKRYMEQDELSLSENDKLDSDDPFTIISTS